MCDRRPSIGAASRRICCGAFGKTAIAGKIPPHPAPCTLPAAPGTLPMRAAIVALGDLGRSARMQYHAHALAAHGVDVDLVGFEGTALPKSISTDGRIHVYRLNPATLRLAGRFFGS